MSEKSSQGSRRTHGAKTEKRVGAKKRQSSGPNTAAKKKSASTNNVSSAPRKTWIVRTVANIGFGGFFSGAAFAVAVTVAVLIFVKADEITFVMDPALQIRLERLEMNSAETEIVESKIRDVEARVQDLAGEVIEFRSSLEDLSQRIPVGVSEDSTEFDIPKWEQRLAELTNEIEILRDGIYVANDPGERSPFEGGLLLVVGQLSSAIARGAPYAGEWDLAKTFASSSPSVLSSLERLKGRRNVGVPTLMELEKGFPPLARLLLRAEAAKASSSWWDRTVLKLGQLVSIRPIGPSVPGDGAPAVTARAEASLASGQLDEAVGLITKLNERTGLASDWLEAARAYLEAEASLDNLIQSAIALASTHKNVPVSDGVSP